MSSPTPMKAFVAISYPKVFSHVLSQIRQEKKMTQGEVAAALNLPISSWSRMERGETTITLEHLPRLAIILEKSLPEIFFMVDQAITELTKKGVIVTASGKDLNELQSSEQEAYVLEAPMDQASKLIGGSMWLSALTMPVPHLGVALASLYLMSKREKKKSDKKNEEK